MASHKGLQPPGPPGPVLGPRSGLQNALHPADTWVERVADRERGSCVGGSPGWDWLQQHHCCSRFIGQNFVSRPPCPAAREAGHCGLTVAQEERDTDSGALTLPATPLLSLARCPRVSPAAPWSPAGPGGSFCALSTLALPLPGLGFAPCSLPSHSPNPSPLCWLVWLDLPPHLSSLLATLLALLTCLGLDHLILGSCRPLPCVCLDGSLSESKSQQDRRESFQISHALKSFLGCWLWIETIFRDN